MLNWGDMLVYRVANDSRIPQIPAVNSQKALVHPQTQKTILNGLSNLDYGCDTRRFWLSAHDCQVPTPTSQNLELEQQIPICEAD